MAYGNAIVVTGDRPAIIKPGIVSGTPKPGTIMELVYDTAPVGGRYTWAAYGTDDSAAGAVTADGDRGVIAVLDVDPTKNATTAYADGDYCDLYFPQPGDELNVLFKNASGTGTDQDVNIGDKLIVDDGTGKVLLSTGTVEAEPFIALEEELNVTADVLIHVMFTGY